MPPVNRLKHSSRSERYNLTIFDWDLDGKDDVLLSDLDHGDYLKNLGFHNNSFIIGALLDPDYLNICNLPESTKLTIIETLKNKINEKPGYLLENSYNNMLAYISQEYNSDLTKSFKMLAELDSRRGLNSQKIFTNLYKLNG